MIIYPTLEILGGRCVSLTRGNLDDPAVWHVDPVEKVREFAQAGAEWIHVTDFDAILGRDTNAELVETLIRAAEVPVQLAGGFRSRERVEHWFDKGAGRIVIGTAAARSPDFLRRTAAQHPDAVVLAIDVQDGQVMVDGWRRRSAFRAEDFVIEFDGEPLAAILCTDIEADLDGNEASLAVISGLADSAQSPVIASGVVRTIDDISRLKYVRNVAGAIVGRALFNRTIDLHEALAVARAEPERVAEFI